VLIEAWNQFTPNPYRCQARSARTSPFFPERPPFFLFLFGIPVYSSHRTQKLTGSRKQPCDPVASRYTFLIQSQEYCCRAIRLYIPILRLARDNCPVVDFEIEDFFFKWLTSVLDSVGQVSGSLLSLPSGSYGVYRRGNSSKFPLRRLRRHRR